MEAQYERLKLSSLKDLLENRGRLANNHKKRDIIAELVEMDRAERPNITERPSVTDRTPEEASFDRAVNIRLAHYGPNPTAEIIDRVTRLCMQIGYSKEVLQQQESRQHQLKGERYILLLLKI
ncbi:hypothetical protein AB205_0122610 [Aquarana catesbeiana]|uniref:Uncharacterized protein n=1 Tax=Aquarana catesbeiana TaxID=8400 RepID=A0A2G9RPC3_AQUCT|nr:hypothetical protein AB205_0122610 [Aquarana catesbeiana]